MSPICLLVPSHQSHLTSRYSLTKLKELNNKFNVPSVRKRLPDEVEKEVVALYVARDANQLNGPRFIKDMLRVDGVAIPR